MLTISQLGPAGLSARIKASQADAGESARRWEYSRRVAILAERYDHLVHQRIDQVYEHTSTREKLKKFVKSSMNVMARIVRQLSFVYSRPPTRRLRLDGPIGEALNDRLKLAERESKIAVDAKQWGAYAFGCNVVWVVPSIVEHSEGMRIEYRMVLPHTAERITSDHDEQTDILLWPTKVDKNEIQEWQAVDAEAYYKLDKNFVPLERIEHGIGRQPAVPLRFAKPPPGDFWDLGRGSKMVEATIECGRVAAAMSWVRKSQNRKLATAFGELGALDRTQLAGPEDAITAKTADADAINFEIHDWNTTIENFKAEMRWHVEQAVEGYGLPISVVDPEPGATGDAVNVFQPAGPQLHAAQAELRDDQLEYARLFERELMINTFELAANFGHPLAIDPVVVAESYEARWQPLAYVDSPANKIAVWERKMALGLMTHADCLLEEYGGDMTPEQARQQVLDNLRDKAEVDLFYAAHNLGVDPRVRSVPQLQGQIGGQMAADAKKDAAA